MGAPFSPYGITRNKAKFAYTGWDAELMICCPESDAADYLDDYHLAEYAASTNMAVVEMIDEPWFPENKDVLDPTTGLSDNRRLTFRFAIVYLNVPWPTPITRPDYALGTTLKLHASYGGRLRPLSPRSIQAASGPVPGPNTQFSVYEALNEYHVEWGRVVDLDSLDFTDYIGAVNSDMFMGCDVGHLLCSGVSLKPSFVLTAGSPLAWTAEAIFKELNINSGGSSYGWNDWFNPATQAWEALTLTDGNPPYDAVAFSGIFS